MSEFLKPTSLAVTLFCTVVFSGFSQSMSDQNSATKDPARIRKNSLYYEAAGIGIFYGSINYDRRITLSERFCILPRIGFSFIDRPLGIAGLTSTFQSKRNPRNQLEFGFDLNSTIVEKKPTPDFLFRIGYRYQGVKGLLFRVAPSYIVDAHIFWGSATLGYSF